MDGPSKQLHFHTPLLLPWGREEVRVGFVWLFALTLAQLTQAPCMVYLAVLWCADMAGCNGWVGLPTPKV